MAVNIDVQIAQQNASVELPANPDADLSATGSQAMAQELSQSPNEALNLQNAINIQSVSDAVTYYGDVLNFSVIDVDGVLVAAESSSDTLEIVAGEGVTLDVDGKAVTIGAAGGMDVPIGTVLDYAGSSIPSGYLECDGSAVSRTTYAKLFTAIGTAWGAGNGSTTFNLPNLNGRTTIGVGMADATGATSHTFGQRSGEETHTLAEGEMPSHNHTLTKSGGVTNYSGSKTSGAGSEHSHSYAHTHKIPDHTHTMQNGGSRELGYLVAQRGSGSANTRVGPYNADTSGVTTITSSPSHKHTVNSSGGGGLTYEQSATTTSGEKAHTHSTDISHGHGDTISFTAGNTGDGSAHNNMQPYAVVRKIIRAA